MWKGRELRGPIDLAVDASQEYFGQAGGGHLAASVRFGINHILENLGRKARCRKPLIQETFSPESSVSP